MSGFQGKRKESAHQANVGVGAATATPASTPVRRSVQETTTEIDAMMEKMTIGGEFEIVLDMINELVHRVNYLAVRIEEVNAKTLEASIDP